MVLAHSPRPTHLRTAATILASALLTAVALLATPNEAAVAQIGSSPTTFEMAASATASALCESQTSIPVAECEAIEAVYTATDGPNWTDNTGWLTHPDPCTWHGVFECRDGHVVWFDLSLNGLSGVIPADIGALTELDILRFWGNDLTGPIPTEIGQLTNLTQLDLSRNRLDGSIPPELGDLTQLWLLYLFGNDLSGNMPASLGNLSNVVLLDLQQNNLSGSIPAELGGLDSVQQLILGGNQLSGTIPASLGSLSQLNLLMLYQNRLHGEVPASLQDLPLLEALAFFGQVGCLSTPSEEFAAWLDELDPDWDDGCSNRYVALGDSFSSGQGAPQYQHSTDTDDHDDWVRPNECHRSLVAYPVVVQDLDGSIPAPDFWACSGARISDLYDKTVSAVYPPWDDPIRGTATPTSQIGRLGDDVSLVTVTISGNDVGFAEVLEHCWWHLGCHKDWERDGVDLIVDRIRGLEGLLTQVYTSIRENAPNASIWVLGYPRIFSEEGCGRISGDEAKQLNAWGEELNEVMGTAATVAGVRFVGEIAGAFGEDRLVCAEDSYVNEVNRGDPEESYHPNVAGHARIAEILVQEVGIAILEPNPPPDPSAVGPGPVGDTFLRPFRSVTIDDAVLGSIALSGTSTITFEIDGLVPGAVYTGSVHSDLYPLGRFTADGGGNVRASAMVPAGLAPGAHMIELEGPDPDGGTALVFGSFLAATDFVDVVDSIFKNDIYWLSAWTITRGCNPPTNDRFCPNSHVTRGQMAAFLVRALGLTNRLDDPFTDDDDSIFENDIERLAAAGITKGCNPPTNDKFCPDAKVTRGQMAAFLVRALGYTDNGGGDLFIDDDDSIFENDIDRLGTAGVTRGCNPPTNDRFCPDGNVTRGQMAAFLHRALG